MGRRRLGSLFCGKGRHLWVEENLVDYGQGPRCKACAMESFARSNARKRQQKIRKTQEQEGQL